MMNEPSNNLLVIAISIGMLACSALTILILIAIRNRRDTSNNSAYSNYHLPTANEKKPASSNTSFHNIDEKL